MCKKILVAYATYKGSTVAVAQALADVLRHDGSIVDVLPVDQVTDLTVYKAVVVGSAIYNGAWLPEAVEFIEGHHRALNRLAVALFAVSLTMLEDTEKSRMTVLGFLDPVLKIVPHVKPADVGLFAGVFDPAKWSLVMRFFLKYITPVPEGDFRDWQAVHAWADYIQSTILHQSQAA